MFSHGTSRNQGGIAICIPNNISGIVETLHRSDDGRILAVQMKQNNSDIAIIAVYGPAGNSLQEKRNFLQELREILIKFGTGNDIILGDFNIHLNDDHNEASREL